jgi:two-component system OmpR family sensor kinase
MDGGEARVTGSLQRHLSLTLAGVIAAIGVAAAAASFGFGYYEAREFQDDALRQVAALAPMVTAPAGRESESRILVTHLPSDSRPPWMPADPAPGFHTFEGSESMRAYVRALPSGGKLVVAQDTSIRDELALNSALRTLVPLFFLLPLLVWLTLRVVARHLAPVRKLAHDLDQESPDRLEPLPVAGLPDEIASFIHAINRLLERVSRLMGEQRRFIADAAHELRSPLAALLLQARNVEGAHSLEESRERLAPLRGGIERARRLTEQLLNLATTQARDVPSERVDLASFARELIAEYLPVAKSRGIDLGLDVAIEVKVLAAPDVLRMIVGNALDNALRYTPAGGQVTLRIAAEGNDAIVEVIDSGPGLPASERERVFDAFHRGEGARGEGGGLGLAIARDAATRLGGRVSLHDAPSAPGLLFRYRQAAAGTG